MDTIISFWGLIVAFIVGGVILALSFGPRKSPTAALTIEGTDFSPSQMFMGKDNLGGIAINERTHQLGLFTSPTSTPHLLPMTDLIGSYLVNNGEILSKAKRRFPEHAMAFFDETHGPTVDLIKNIHLSSSQGPNQRIDLLVVVQDQNNPIHFVNFLNMDTKEGGIIYEKAINAAKHWQFVIEGLLLQVDHLTKVQAETPQDKELTEATP